MKKEPTIVHVLADGRRVNSIEGYIVPADNTAYNVIVEAVKQQKRGANKQCSKRAC